MCGLRLRSGAHRRREFITALGGAAAAWPLAASAQQPNRMRRIGVLTPFAANDAESQARLTAFAQGLHHWGWIVGQNIRIEYRWGDGKADTMPNTRLNSSRSRPMSYWPLPAPPSHHCWRCPHRPNRVRGCRRPGRGRLCRESGAAGSNATGFTVFEYSMGGKWLEVLKEVAPRVTRAAVLRDSTIAAGPGQSARSRRWRHRSAWTCAPLICAVPTR